MTDIFPLGPTKEVSHGWKKTRAVSMGSVGDAYDNAMCESFFATLQCELLDRRSLPTVARARREVFRPARFAGVARYPSPPWEEREKKPNQTPSTPKPNRP